MGKIRCNAKNPATCRVHGVYQRQIVPTDYPPLQMHILNAHAKFGEMDKNQLFEELKTQYSQDDINNAMRALEYSNLIVHRQGQTILKGSLRNETDVRYSDLNIEADRQLVAQFDDPAIPEGYFGASAYVQGGLGVYIVKQAPRKNDSRVVGKISLDDDLIAMHGNKGFHVHKDAVLGEGTYVGSYPNFAKAVDALGLEEN